MAQCSLINQLAGRLHQTFPSRGRRGGSSFRVKKKKDNNGKSLLTKSEFVCSTGTGILVGSFLRVVRGAVWYKRVTMDPKGRYHGRADFQDAGRECMTTMTRRAGEEREGFRRFVKGPCRHRGDGSKEAVRETKREAPPLTNEEGEGECTSAVLGG